MRKDNELYYNLYKIYQMINLRMTFIFILALLLAHDVLGWCWKFTITQVDKIRCVDYSPDGSMIALGLEDNSVKLYDAASYTLRHSFNAPNKPNSVKFNKLNTHLAVGSLHSNVVILTIATLTTSTIPTTQNEVYSITFNSDSSIMATCGKDNQLRLWNAVTWSNTAITPTFPTQGALNFMACQFTSDDRLIIGDSGGSVKTYASPYLVANLVSTTVTYGAAITSVSNRFSSLDYIVTQNSGKKAWASFDNTSPVISVGPKTLETSSYAKTIDYFMIGGNDKKVLIFNATGKNNSLVQSIAVTGNILSSDFSDDGKNLAVGCDDDLVMIYGQFCIQCDVPYFYNDSSKACQTCASAIQGCGICYSSTTCATCSHGFYITSAKICALCNTPMIGCGACTNSSYCKVALPGYYITSGNLPNTCENPMPGCLICNSSTVCLQCHNDYYISSNKCVACSGVTNCLKCYNSSYCTQCEMGYYPNTAVASTSTCSRCATNCLDCQSLTACFECVVGFYTTGGTCQQCTANCLACNNTNFCYDCITGTFLTTTGTCSACTIPCLSCLTSATTCLSCYNGYYLNGTSSCVLCPTGCSSCTSNSICSSCVQGYYYDSGTTSCIRCNVTYTNCQSCNSTNCTLCLTSFYYDSAANLCRSCSNQMHGCVLCSSATTCLFCAPGHYLSALTGNNSCQPCSAGCSTCQTNSNCTACTPGYFLDTSAFTCPKCTSRCMTCKTSSTFCQSCIIGYYLSSAVTGTCSACNATKAYCLACVFDSSNVLQCIQCGVGFYLNSGSCSRCGSNCVTCSAASTCLSCQLGAYFNSTDSTCRTCSPGCSECSANGTCESCHIGYYFSSPNCLACATLGCLTCGADLKCLSCVSGYYLVPVTNVCQICSNPLSNCLACSSSTTCSQCAYGFALTTSGASTICSTCSNLTGCFHCSSLSVCLGCQSGYYLNGNTCTACIDGCRTCANSTYCMECGSSYFSGDVLGGANIGACLRCEFYLDGCELCDNTTTCINCQSGYYLATVASTTVCKLCQINIPQCTLCNTSTICTSCKGGYYLASNSLSCIQCSTTFSACRLCQRLGSACTACQSGYYLASGNCLLCNTNLPGCQLCSAANTCIDCQSGYFLNSPNCQLCSSTIPGCIFCNSSSVCLQCEGGYYLDSTTFRCVPCSVVGCEVCIQSAPTQCVTCNSLYFKSSSTACSLCRTSMAGCLTCSSSSICSKCDVGYYQNGSPPPQCSLCSDAMQGCSICSSSTTCIQCKSMYFLNSTNKCQTCSQPLTGCTFCTNNTICLSCGSGFFLNSSSLCQSCTDLPGCLICKDAATCLFCDTGYYFNAFSCLTCANITGCYSCISATVCTSCVGGYTLNSASGCDVAKIQGNQKVTDILLKTFYVNSTTLKHFLYTKGMAFSKVSLNWQANMSLFLFTKSNTKVNLVIKDVQWASDNNYTLIVYTDNPIDYSSKTKKMPFARRVLQSLDLQDTKTGIQLSEEAIRQMLPNYQHSGSLVLDYGLNNPEFYASYTKELTSQFPFFAIGAAFVGILFFKYLIKALITVPKSSNMGNIIPHIMAFKVGALLLFPTYIQYINYCSGFMYADMPWLNRFFGESLSDKRDVSPAPYSLFYDNMNLASMYLLAISIFILLVIIIVLVGKNLPKYQYKMYSSLSFIYNFFAFGMFFAGCGSFQGAIMNPIESLNVNSVFYILGILLYFLLVCECIYRVSQDKTRYFWRVRILLKATLLSLSHFSPIYLLSSTVVLDFVLILVQFQLNPYSKNYCKSWLFSNIICNLALVLLVFLPIIQLTMVLVSAMIFLAICAEAVMHYQETKTNATGTKLNTTEIEDQRNMWDLNFTDKEINKKETQNNFYSKTKTSLKSGVDNENMATMYPKQTENKKEDLDETQVFNSKYKRNRNYKKVREEAKAKRLYVEDIRNKSNPNNNSNEINEGVKEQNLTFVMQEVQN